MAKKTTEEKTEETSAATEGASYVSKLSIKALGCDPRLPQGGTSKVLCRIYGMGKGLKHGEDKTTGNLWTALQGEFEGVNTEQGNEDFGKTVRSGKLFLPAGIQDMIEGAIREIENSKDGATEPNVMFGLEIRSVKAANRIGYSYEAKNLLPPKQQDPLGSMREVIEAKAGAIKALPAPKA